jgi:phosphoglycolate phosphatase-like HAD superfamily hydrolase
MIRLIISDMDGTVVNSMEVLSTLGVALLATAGSTEMDAAREHYNQTVGSPFHDQVCAWSENFTSGQSIRRIVEAYELVHRSSAPYFPLTDFGQSLVNFSYDLHPQFILALVTSTRSDIVELMPQIHQIPWTHVSGYQGRGTEKLFQIRAVMRAVHIFQPDVCYIGDSAMDEEIAKFYDIPFFHPSSTTLAEILVHDSTLGDSPARLMGA